MTSVVVGSERLEILSVFVWSLSCDNLDTGPGILLMSPHSPGP